MDLKPGIAIMGSGEGSNAQVLIDMAASGTLPVAVRLVASDNPHARILQRARLAGIDTFCQDVDEVGREVFEHQLVDELVRRSVSLVVLAGFMRICGPVFLNAYEGRALNVHPSLLPRFAGRDAIGAALAAGVTETGVTVHMIDSGVDTGPVIEQMRVPILDGDSRETLRRRIQWVEHRLLPRVVASVATGIATNSQHEVLSA